ncbi:MAG: hypothetical protein WAL26_01965 [Mycobacterium sp.]
MTPTNTVRGFMEQYEHGTIDFPTLMSMIASHPIPEKDDGPHLGWAEVYQRAEEMPDDDDPFWITVAADLGILTEEREERLLAAIYGSENGPS